jgi:hypothetical protein
MSHIEIIDPLIKEKHEIIRKIAEKTSTKKDDERLGEIEYLLKQKVIGYIQTPPPTITPTPKKEGMTSKELRKILNTKYAHYKEMAIQSREIYAQLLIKKQEGRDINELTKKEETPSKTTIEKVMRY